MTLSWMPLPDQARRVAESLYERQPATPAELAARTRLPPPAIEGALSALRSLGVLRGGVPLRDGRPGYLWLDLVPAARRALEVAA